MRAAFAGRGPPDSLLSSETCSGLGGLAGASLSPSDMLLSLLSPVPSLAPLDFDDGGTSAFAFAFAFAGILRVIARKVTRERVVD